MVLRFLTDDLANGFAMLCKSMDLHGSIKRDGIWHKVRVNFDTTSAPQTTKRKLIARWAGMTCETIEGGSSAQRSLFRPSRK